jgi:shikimate kinase
MVRFQNQTARSKIKCGVCGQGVRPSKAIEYQERFYHKRCMGKTISKESTDTTRWLVILRGPTGVGKSKVAESLRKTLHMPAYCVINLDNPFPPPNLTQTLQCQYVIAEVYSGGDNTANPESWVGYYTTRGYRVLSIVLDADLDIVIQRNISDTERPPRPIELITRLHRSFYEEQKFQDFANAAKIEEFRINTNRRDSDWIASEIRSELSVRSSG